jgi:hypothetical protein
MVISGLLHLLEKEQSDQFFPTGWSRHEGKERRQIKVRNKEAALHHVMFIHSVA